MKTKKFFIGMAVFLSVSLFLIGCPTEADGSVGERGSAGLSAGTLPDDASVALFDAYFSRLDTVFLTAALDTGTFKVPKGKTLVVVGDVTLISGTVINAFDGTLDVADGGFAGSNGVLIVADAKAAEVKAKAASLIVPKYVAAIGETEIDEDVVLSSLTIGDEGWDDFATFAGSTYTVYVTGDAAIDATTAIDTSSAKLTVFGDVTAKGTLTLGANTTIGKVTATGTLGLTGIARIKELNTATYVVTAATGTSVTLDKLDSGAGGKLVLQDAVFAVTIGAGNGNIEFNTGAPVFATSISSFGNTGLTTFKAAVTAAIGITFDGPVAFEGTFGFTDVAVAFNNTVSFADDVTRTTGGALSFGGNVTLEKEKAITLGGTATVTLKAGAAINAALSAGDADVVLTPATGAVLTVDASDDKKIALSTAGLAVTSGTLSVATGAELAVPTSLSLSVAAGAVLDIVGDVSLAGTGSVVLATAATGQTGGAKITGTGKLTAQDAEIVGGTGGWLAVLASGSTAATVTIASTATNGQATITGSATSHTASLKGGAGAAITQKSGTVSNSLTLTTVTVDLSADGSFTLKGATTNGAKVVLVAVTAIIKGAGDTGAVTTANVTAIGDVDATSDLTIGTSVAFTDDESGNAFETIKGDASNNSIEAKADSTDLTLDKTTTLTYT
jgi:hypothetical protein